jgi:hypothetical protein
MNYTQIVHYKYYVAGWLNSSIHDFLRMIPPNSRSMKYALITCIDSNLDLRSLLGRSPELRPIAKQVQPLEGGLLLPTKLLVEADSRSQIFFGFDEIWFFPSERIQPKPNSASLVGPARIDQRRLDKLGKWMSRNSCALALGDGAGLNFVVKARGVVGHLLGHSIEQSQPSVTPFEIADSAETTICARPLEGAG